MQRYRHASRLPLGLGLLLAAGGCAIPTQRENLDATAQLVAGQVAAPLVWRRDEKADASARQHAEAMLADGLTLQEAIAVSFLASPELQLALEKLEISRADFVAASTPPNPVALAGTRQPNGDLAAFYPDRTVSFGVLQNVVGLINIPSRRGVARQDLERARYVAANSAVRQAAEVAQSWIDYAATLQVVKLRERTVALYQLSYNNLRSRQAQRGDVAAQTLDSEHSGLLSRQGDLIRAQLDAARARADLGERLGIAGWRDDWSVQQTLPPMPATDPDPQAEEQAAMQRRLDLRAASTAVVMRLKALAHQRHFRWLNEVDLGLFRDQVTGGTGFTGPNAVVELPVFDQHQANLLNADAQWRSAMRNLDAARLTARNEIRTHAAEMSAARQLLEQIEQDIQPGQRQRLATPAGGDPNDTNRLRLQVDILSTDVDHVDLLRDYWRARSALALAAGDWSAQSGLTH
jgi:cobalt-zinc-cadmium efflux system outer membrane protein